MVFSNARGGHTESETGEISSFEIVRFSCNVLGGGHLAAMPVAWAYGGGTKTEIRWKIPYKNMFARRPMRRARRFTVKHTQLYAREKYAENTPWKSLYFIFSFRRDVLFYLCTGKILRFSEVKKSVYKMKRRFWKSNFIFKINITTAAAAAAVNTIKVFSRARARTHTYTVRYNVCRRIEPRSRARYYTNKILLRRAEQFFFIRI